MSNPPPPDPAPTPRSFWKSYQSLSPRTRLLAGSAVIAYAIAGLWVADTAEEKLGFTPSEEDRQKLKEIVPTVRVVERRE